MNESTAGITIMREKTAGIAIMNEGNFMLLGAVIIQK
jgi:hypothetical protein